jgi:hypothetical protein
MRPRLSLPLLAAALLAFGALSPAPASTLVPLRPDAQSSAPELTVLAADARGVRLAFELPALEVETYAQGGRSFQTAAFARAELMGEIGEPVLPEFTRFVAIPARSGATLRVTATEEQTLYDFHLLPMQQDDTPSLEMDLATYARDELLGGPTVELGAPALMRELRVVPITFRPVRYNPARGELRVLRRIELTVDFAGTDTRNAPARAQFTVSRDLDDFYRTTVINYDAGGRPDPWPTANDLGCWLILAREDAGVRTRIQPLIDWRARMGYKTVLATTAQTGISANQIKAWIQNAYDTWAEPPEYIVLVGDVTGAFGLPTFYEPYSGCNGEGDHSYVQLAGDDLLPDAFVGRISAEDLDMLDMLIGKIVGYETTPLVSGPDWFARACLVGDPGSSGITCVQVQQWLKEKLRRIGYAQIDTVFGAPFASRITTSVNTGVSYVGYRGFYGTSGWNDAYVYALNNGAMLPFSVMLTCGTGSFAGGTSLNEAWFRGVTGAPYTVKGAIGAVGTATTCTHTRFNNCFYVGTAYGLFWDGLYKLGRAQARGKVEMALNYGAYDFSDAARYCWWNNLMGDPATELWTGWPATPAVDCPAVVPLGADQVRVNVTVAGLPRSGAWVYLYRNGALGVGGLTDETGSVALPIADVPAGTVLLTVTAHNLAPYRGSFAIAQQPRFVGLGGYTIDDDAIPPSAGNGDGSASPGETIRPLITLENYGTETATGVSLSLAIDDPYVAVLSSGPIDYGTIAPGASAAPTSGFVLCLSPFMPPGHPILLDLTAASGSDAWPSRLVVPLVAADLVKRGYTLAGCGAQLDPGETAQLSVSLANLGGLTAPGPIHLSLISESYAVRASNPDATIPGSVLPGHIASSSPFGIRSPLDCVPGSLALLRISLTFADGTRDTAEITVPVGTADEQDPTGPDAYGYYAYDNRDVAYPQHPIYDWIDINPNAGGGGHDVGLTDNGNSQDDTNTITLPFIFRFYGQAFDRVSVCSNGFLGMGSSYAAPAQNWYLPSALGAPNMIAPFWDDLYQSGAGRVYAWYDQPNHRFVIAWDDVRQEATGNPESFEVILYDPAWYPTPTGDGEVVCQYEVVYNSDSVQMYSTVGIQNGDHTTGLTFNYFNQRPATAAPLGTGLAVKFTTAAPGASGTGEADAGAPALFRLRANEPNPFHDGTTIRFALDRGGPVLLRVFDVNGQVVRTLYRGALPAGEHALRWTGMNDQDLPAPAGVYFYRLDAGEKTSTKKLLRLR